MKFNHQKRARESSTYDERINIIDKKSEKARKRLKFQKTTPKHWFIPYKYPNNRTTKKPLWKIYNGEPIKLTEYRYLVNYFKYKGLTFSYPIDKIKFVNEETMEQAKKLVIS